MTEPNSERTSFTSFLVGVGIFTAMLMTSVTGYRLLLAPKTITCFYDQYPASVSIKRRIRVSCEEAMGPHWHSQPPLQ